MSDASPQEPTMEEILASIRRIISEDDAPAAAVEDEVDEPAHAAEDDVLELTEQVEELSPVETLGDLDVFTPPPRAPEPEPEAYTPPPKAEPAPVAAAPAKGLIGEPAAQSAASDFGRLARHVALPADGQTLEGVVRAMLNPLLKAWLDEHLPTIVQAKVDEEVERIARQR